MRSKVVLPHPLGPTIETNSPGLISSRTPSSAVSSWPSRVSKRQPTSRKVMPSEAEAGLEVSVTSFPVLRLVDDGLVIELVELTGKSIGEEFRWGGGF